MATNPTLLTMPIAENGQKNTIPATQAAAGDGLLSQSTGFPPETALPLGAGGKAPTREDFNGALNLLSDIAFYSQKGWTFQYDENQAYYKGCIVMDTTNGLRYECINDVEAGTILPSADQDNDYWREYSPGGVPLGSIIPYAANAAEPPYSFLFCEGQAVSRAMYPDLFALIGTTYGAGDGENTFNLPNLIDAAMLNGSYTKTSYTTAGSATFTAPKTGWYRITVKGGGGGGEGGVTTSTYVSSGRGGGEGGTAIGYERMTAGQTASVVIGAGGAGGAGASTNANRGSGIAGGDSTVTVNLNTYTGGGGGGSDNKGGTGTIPGNPGENRAVAFNSSSEVIYGGNGGGAGGGNLGAASFNVRQNGTQGGGGAGGGGQVSSGNYAKGGNGGDGYVTIEYIGISMKYILKAYDAPTPSSAQIDLSQYASDLARRLTREMTPAFNKRDVITVSGTYTAPVTGWYRIVVKGGGGGGQGGNYASAGGQAMSGGGGGEGGTTVAYEKMTAGDTASVVIGAGGAGGAAQGGNGASGGSSTVTVNNTTYTGGGGGSSSRGGTGGSGTSPGAPGGTSVISAAQNLYGASGGGNGGGTGGTRSTAGNDGINGGGGGGGGADSRSATYIASAAGGAGGDGYAWFEYFDGSLN